MGRIKKWIEWIVFVIIAVVTFGVVMKREGKSEGEAEGRAEADHAAVQKERERVAGESTEELYDDFTGKGGRH